MDSTILRSIVEFGRLIRLIDPEKLPDNEIQRDAYNAGYESEVSDKNPHALGSINYRSWDQGKRERARYEQTLW